MGPKLGNFTLKLWDSGLAWKSYLPFEITLLKALLKGRVTIFWLLWLFPCFIPLSLQLFRIYNLFLSRRSTVMIISSFDFTLPWIFGSFVLCFIFGTRFPKPTVFHRLSLFPCRRLLGERISFIEIEFFLDIGKSIIIFMSEWQYMSCKFRSWLILFQIILLIFVNIFHLFERWYHCLFSLKRLKFQFEFSNV